MCTKKEKEKEWFDDTKFTNIYIFLESRKKEKILYYDLR